MCLDDNQAPIELKQLRLSIAFIRRKAFHFSALPGLRFTHPTLATAQKILSAIGRNSPVRLVSSLLRIGHQY